MNGIIGGRPLPPHYGRRVVSKIQWSDPGMGRLFKKNLDSLKVFDLCFIHGHRNTQFSFADHIFSHNLWGLQLITVEAVDSV